MPADHPNLATQLRAGYAHHLDDTFLVEPAGRRWTYRQLEAHANAFAGVLASRGAGQGTRVLTKTAKSPEAIALYLACLQVGAIYVPLNPAFTPAEVSFFVEDASPVLAIVDPEDPPSPGVATLTLGPDGTGTLARSAASESPWDGEPSSAPEDIAAMLYTSGTTGRSKGAMLSNRALMANAYALNTKWGFTSSDVLVHALPIFHTHGLFVAMHCAMLSGAEVRFLPKFNVEEVLAELPSATVMMGVPTMYARLMADSRFVPAVCQNMRLFTSGSAPMTEVLHQAFTEQVGHRILERYGMTEAGIIASNPLQGERIPGTVGFALPGYDLRIATDDGPGAPGETGLVEIKGPHLFDKYWGLPEKTAEEFRPDGYFITGDVGSLDHNGRLTLQGRAGDMIISGGENVYPKEIEMCLDACAGVVESAVVGLPHPDFGETVVACLVVDGAYDPARVEAAVIEGLARFKHPRRYEFFDELPRNAMGKVQKAALRHLLSE